MSYNRKKSPSATKKIILIKNKKCPLKSYDPSLLVTLRIEFSLEIKRGSERERKREGGTEREIEIERDRDEIFKV